MFRQVCPICKKEVRFHAKYPYYLCDVCITFVTDRNKKSIIYLPNPTPTGFKAYYKDSPEKPYIYDLCYVGEKEFRAYPEKGKYIFIQPIDFLEFAIRPENDNSEPEDPEFQKGKNKGNILIKKILLPALIVTALTTLLPVLTGLFAIQSEFLSVTKKLTLFLLLNSTSLLISTKIIFVVVKKFPKAKYFKQHSWSFLIIGFLIVSIFSFLIFCQKF